MCTSSETPVPEDVGGCFGWRPNTCRVIRRLSGSRLGPLPTVTRYLPLMCCLVRSKTICFRCPYSWIKKVGVRSTHVRLSFIDLNVLIRGSPFFHETVFILDRLFGDSQYKTTVMGPRFLREEFVPVRQEISTIMVVIYNHLGVVKDWTILYLKHTPLGRFLPIKVLWFVQYFYTFPV